MRVPKVYGTPISGAQKLTIAGIILLILIAGLVLVHFLRTDSGKLLQGNAFFTILNSFNYVVRLSKEKFSETYSNYFSRRRNLANLYYNNGINR